jgi:HEAT repeat protein
MNKKRQAAKNSKSAGKSKSAAKRPLKRSSKSALSIGTSARNTVKQRVAAMAEAPQAVCESDANLQAMLNVLRNKDEPVKVRLAALQSLQAASFSSIAFESCRPDYIATLRQVAEDTDMELRQRVLGLLSRENDGFAQKKLLEGLQNPEKALVPPEKALQLLSYDIHSEAYPVARQIVSNPPNPVAKREALRLLAADATSAPMFEKILRDKEETAENRQISASALQALKPESLQENAREMLLDKSEFDDIRATSLTALTQFGDDTAIANDKALLKSVDVMSDEASTTVKQHARRFLSKYGR